MPTILELRTAKGWSQQELASRAHVGIHTVGKMEKGKPALAVTAEAVARALGVKLENIEGVNVVNQVLRRKLEQ